MSACAHAGRQQRVEVWTCGAAQLCSAGRRSPQWASGHVGQLVEGLQECGPCRLDRLWGAFRNVDPVGLAGCRGLSVIQTISAERQRRAGSARQHQAAPG
eukprot:351704-Chlamydomonas_euryale.AAC.1